jgi:hypothetical protein
MKKVQKELVKKAFSIIGEELSNLKDSPIGLTMNIGNFRKDGFDIVFKNNRTEGEVEFIYYLAGKIRLDNNIWFDSGFSTDGEFIEWNFDWSLEQVDGE